MRGLDGNSVKHATSLSGPYVAFFGWGTVPPRVIP